MAGEVVNSDSRRTLGQGQSYPPSARNLPDRPMDRPPSRGVGDTATALMRGQMNQLRREAQQSMERDRMLREALRRQMEGLSRQPQGFQDLLGEKKAPLGPPPDAALTREKLDLLRELLLRSSGRSSPSGGGSTGTILTTI